MLEDLRELYEEILEEGRVSQHQFSDMSLKDAYQTSYNIFKNLGFTTAATFAVMDYIYRLLPESIKTPEIQQQKKKSFGAYLRPFVVNLINNNLEKIDLNKLKSKMVNEKSIKQYLQRNDYGNRRQGLLKKLSDDSGRDIAQDY